MTQLLLVAHAPLAQAWAQVLAHVYPDAADAVQALDVAPDWDAARVQTAVSAALRRLPVGEDVLVLTDVAGATPCNGAQAALAANNRAGTAVVAGTSVPMLWRAACHRKRALAELLPRVLEIGAQAAADVTLGSATRAP